MTEYTGDNPAGKADYDGSTCPTTEPELAINPECETTNLPGVRLTGNQLFSGCEADSDGAACPVTADKQTVNGSYTTTDSPSTHLTGNQLFAGYEASYGGIVLPANVPIAAICGNRIAELNEHRFKTSPETYSDWPEILQYRINNYTVAGNLCIFTVKWMPGMAGDFRDIRFSDSNDTKLSYYRESYTPFSTATFYVKLESSADVNLYYGNGTAVSESTDSPFAYNDGFSADTSDDYVALKSAVIAYDSVDKCLEQTSTSTTSSHWIISTKDTNLPDIYMYECRVKITNDTASRNHGGIALEFSTTAETGYRLTHLDNTFIFSRYTNGTEYDKVSFSDGGIYADDRWLTYRIFRNRLTGTIVFNVVYGSESVSKTVTNSVYTSGHIGLHSYGCCTCWGDVKVFGVPGFYTFDSVPTSVLVSGRHNNVPESKAFAVTTSHLADYARSSVAVSPVYSDTSLMTFVNPANLNIGSVMDVSNDQYPDFSEVIQYEIKDHPGEGCLCSIDVNWMPGMAGDFRDIRFSDGLGEKVSYFIEEQTDFSYAQVKIRLRNSSTIYMHYGNGAAASESDSWSVYDVFEDCSGDLSNWTVQSGTWSIQNGRLRGEGTGSQTRIAPAVPFYLAGPKCINVTFRFSSDSDYGALIRFGEYSRIQLFPSSNQLSWYAESEVKASITVVPGVDYVIEYCRSSNLVTVNVNGIQYISTLYTGYGGVFELGQQMPIGSYAEISDLKVWNYAETEPTAKLVGGWNKGIPSNTISSLYRETLHGTAESSVSIPIVSSSVSSSAEDEGIQLYRTASLSVAPNLVNSTIQYYPFLRVVTYDNNHPYAQWPGLVTYFIKRYPGEGYVVIFDIDWKPGMRADFSDIRFSDGNGEELTYYLSKYDKFEFETAMVYVRLKQSPTVYLHYGNPLVESESNGDNTFDFFDDFSYNTLQEVVDSGKWTGSVFSPQGEYITVRGSGNTLPGSKFRALESFGASYIFGARMKTSRYSGLERIGFSFPSATSGSYTPEDYSQAVIFNFHGSVYINGYCMNMVLVQQISDWSSDVVQADESIWSVDTYGLVELVRLSSSSQLRINRVVKCNIESSLNYPTGKLYPFFGSYAVDDIQTIDYCFVRKCATVEPVPVMLSSSFADPDFLQRISTLWGFSQIRDSIIGCKTFEMLAGPLSGNLREAGANVGSIQADSSLTKAYFRTSLHYVGSILESGVPVQLNRRFVDISIPAIYSNAEKGDFDHRELQIYVQHPEVSAEWKKAYYRPASMSVTVLQSNVSQTHDSFRGSTVGTVMLRTYCLLDVGFTRQTDCSLPGVCKLVERVLQFERPASHTIPIQFDENVTRVIHQHRQSGVSVHSIEYTGSRRCSAIRFDYKKYGVFCQPFSVMFSRITNTHQETDIAVSPFFTSIERCYPGLVQRRYGYSRIPALETIVDVALNVYRYAENMMQEIKVEAGPGIYREASCSMSSVTLELHRNNSVLSTVLCDVGTIELGSSDSQQTIREGEARIIPVYQSVYREGTFDRPVEAKLTTIKTEGTGKAIIDRVVETFLTSLFADSSRIINLVRGFAFEVPAVQFTVVAVANYDSLYQPFEIVIDKSGYIITVDQPEYGVSLGKSLYYAVVRDGDSMIEITQYDTDTFTATLQDTDPVTEELRSMPLAGKSVKLVLKGGAPDTVVAVDCTVVEDGKVQFSLNSTDTAVSGNYIMKFVVIGDGYRKELPENRDDYQQLVINDATYTEV